MPGVEPPSRAVTFDVWYTLVYLRPAEEDVYVASLVDAATDLLVAWPAGPKGRPAPTRAVAREAFRAEFERAAALSRQGISWTPSQQIRSVAEQLGRRAKPLEYVWRVEELVERLPLRRATGATRVLPALRTAGYRLGVISNTVGEPGDAMQRVLRRLGLASSFDAWAWSDQHPWSKPSPELFRWCLTQLRVPPARAIHVGDGWSDVVGARRAGLHASVQFTGHASYSASYARTFAPPIPPEEAPTRIIRSLGTLPRLIPELFGALDAGTSAG